MWSYTPPVGFEIRLAMRPRGELCLDCCSATQMYARYVFDGKEGSHHRSRLLEIPVILRTVRGGEYGFLADSLGIQRVDAWVRCHYCGHLQGFVWARSLELALAILGRSIPPPELPSEAELEAFRRAEETVAAMRARQRELWEKLKEQGPASPPKGRRGKRRRDDWPLKD